MCGFCNDMCILFFTEGHLVHERLSKPLVQCMKGSMHDRQTWPGPVSHVIYPLGQNFDFINQIQNPSFINA